MKTILYLMLASSAWGQILAPILGGTSPTLTLTATTVSPSQTVTIQQLNLNVATVITWGDGGTTNQPAGTATAVTHVYASAGTYNITVPSAQRITAIDLRDAKLGGLNTSQLRNAPVSYFYITAITGSTIRSADMAAWRPGYWYLYSMPTGTYSISSADMAAWTGITSLNYYSMLTTPTISAGGLATQPAMTTLNFSGNALSAAQVNQVLADLVVSLGIRGAVKCTVTLGGTNAAPTGQGILDKATLVAAGFTVTTN